MTSPLDADAAASAGERERDDVEGLFLELDSLSCPRVWEAPKDGGPCFYCGVPMPGHSVFCPWQLMRQQLKHAKEAYRAHGREVDAARAAKGGAGV